MSPEAEYKLGCMLESYNDNKCKSNHVYYIEKREVDNYLLSLCNSNTNADEMANILHNFICTEGNFLELNFKIKLLDTYGDLAYGRIKRIPAHLFQVICEVNSLKTMFGSKTDVLNYYK